MEEKILYGIDARQALLRGAAQLANVAKITLGPCGRNVVLNRHFGVLCFPEAYRQRHYGWCSKRMRRKEF